MDDEGSPALELITVGVVLIVPLVYLIVALGAIQEQTLGAEAAARQTARVIALAPDADTAEQPRRAVREADLDGGDRRPPRQDQHAGHHAAAPVVHGPGLPPVTGSS